MVVMTMNEFLDGFVQTLKLIPIKKRTKRGPRCRMVNVKKKLPDPGLLPGSRRKIDHYKTADGTWIPTTVVARFRRVFPRCAKVYIYDATDHFGTSIIHVSWDKWGSRGRYMLHF